MSDSSSGRRTCFDFHFLLYFFILQIIRVNFIVTFFRSKIFKTCQLSIKLHYGFCFHDLLDYKLVCFRKTCSSFFFFFFVVLFCCRCCHCCCCCVFLPYHIIIILDRHDRQMNLIFLSIFDFELYIN